MDILRIGLVMAAGLGSTWAARVTTDALLGATPAQALVQATDQKTAAQGSPAGGSSTPPAVPAMSREEMDAELKRAQAGQTLMVDTGCVVAYTSSIGFEIQYVGKIKTALFGGEGLFFARLTGPGTVWLQSLPFSRLASRVFAAAPQAGSGGRDEGSILPGVAGAGILGGILGGDDE